MTQARTAHSSDDIEQARRISRRLRGQSGGVTQPSNTLGYIRFSARPFLAAQPKEMATTFGPAVWNEMLDLCMDRASAELAFVVDNQGLIIGSRGDHEPSLIEGIGARLLIAFEQTDQMSALGEPSESIAIQMGRRWLTGLRLRRGEAKPVIVGVLGPEVLSQETRDVIERMLDRH